MRAARPRRIALIGGALAVVAGAGWYALSRDGGGTDLAREGSTVVEGAGPLRPADPLLAYRITYRVDNYAGGDHIVTTDELIVRRPFESRLRAKAGAPPGGAVQSTTTSNFGVLQSSSPNAVAFSTFVPPGVAGGDLRFDAALEALVQQGAFERRERRQVLGRDCQVYRTGEPVGTGRLVKPADREYADECIDATGLLLEEVWVLDGAPIRRKLAVAFDGRPRLDADAFAIEAAPLPLEQRGAAVIELTADSRPPATFWELGAAPTGFSHRGRYRVVSAMPGAAPGTAALATDSVVDVFVDGPALLLIEQGASPPTDDTQGRVVKVGELGQGRLTAGVLGSEIVARPDAARLVRIVGTLAPDELVRIAAALRPGPAGTLTPKQ
jgi:hypothetical protein